jgi:redox-sensitive bicupin YhaK (pirin superfamily)
MTASTSPTSTAPSSSSTARSVQKTVRGRPTSDGAGVKLTRVIGTPELRNLDPFLMLDVFGSDDPDAYIAGFPNHPHRGFETVTYMLAGRMRHGDNQGNSGILRAGSVQWMTAGRGIVHSEMPEQTEGLMKGFQLWVNLPARDKMCAPRYQNIEPEALRSVRVAPGVMAKVVAGELEGVRGPVETGATEARFYDVTMEPASAVTLPLPEGHKAFVLVFEGSARVGEGAGARDLAENELAVLTEGSRVTATAASKGARFLLVAGRPIGEPIVQYGPFVMNTEAEIHQAIADMQAGRL